MQTGGHRQNQAAQVEGDQTHPERNGGSLDQRRSGGGSGKQKETGNTLKVESTRVVDGLDLGGGRREGKDDSKVYGLSY